MKTRTMLTASTGLALLTGAALLIADEAPEGPRDLEKGRQAELRRGFGQSCDEGVFPVTWPVFDPTLRPLVLEAGTDFLPCFDIGDDSLLDLDGDGRAELWKEDGAGFFWDNYGESRNSPLTAMRRREGALAIEVVLNFEGDLQYWLEQLDQKSPPEFGSLAAEHDGFFDVDGDGNLDLMFRVSLDDWKTGNRTKRYFWFRNTSVPPGRSGDSDLNGDGRVDGEDLLQLLSDWSG